MPASIREEAGRASYGTVPTMTQVVVDEAVFTVLIAGKSYSDFDEFLSAARTANAEVRENDPKGWSKQHKKSMVFEAMMFPTLL